MWFLPALEWLGAGALRAAPWFATFFLGKEAVDNLTTSDSGGWTGGGGNMSGAPTSSTTSLWQKVSIAIIVVISIILAMIVFWIFRLLFPKFSIKKVFKK